ncbi:hypothetical protein BGZ68_002166 [Mortierella alpina]|nr:hypothetical protein BGZ68_002166 [Mortierella alpina]
MDRFRRTCSNDPASLSSSGSSMSALLDRVPNVGFVTNYDQLSSSFPPLLALTARSSPSSSFGFPSALASNADGVVLNTKQQSHDQHKTRRSLTKHELQAMDPDPNQKLHGRPRPFFKAKDGTIKIHRTLPDHTPCAICGTTQTPIWRKRPDNTVICNGCSLISKQSRSLDFSSGAEAQPFPSPPQSIHSRAAVYTSGRKTRQRSRGKGSAANTLSYKNERDDFGSHKRSRHRNSAITEMEERKKRDEDAVEFYSGYHPEIGPAADVGPGNSHGPHHCNVHGGYGSCRCSHYFDVSVSTCDGHHGQGQNAVGSATDTLSTMPRDATVAQ